MSCEGCSRWSKTDKNATKFFKFLKSNELTFKYMPTRDLGLIYPPDVNAYPLAMIDFSHYFEKEDFDSVMKELEKNVSIHRNLLERWAEEDNHEEDT